MGIFVRCLTMASAVGPFRSPVFDFKPSGRALRVPGWATAQAVSNLTTAFAASGSSPIWTHVTVLSPWPTDAQYINSITPLGPSLFEHIPALGT